MEIIGFPNYLIFKNGSILSKGFKSNYKKPGFLQHYQDSCGYYSVNLCNDGNQGPKRIHRLLALHYIPNPNNYPMVDHIDRNKINNSLNNLRWVTPSQNSQNSQKQGKPKNNTSGHINIQYRKDRDTWFYTQYISGVYIFRKGFKSKIDCICYKYICLLKINIKVK